MESEFSLSYAGTSTINYVKSPTCERRGFLNNLLSDKSLVLMPEEILKTRRNPVIMLDKSNCIS